MSKMYFSAVIVSVSDNNWEKKFNNCHFMLTLTFGLAPWERPTLLFLLDEFMWNWIWSMDCQRLKNTNWNLPFYYINWHSFTIFGKSTNNMIVLDWLGYLSQIKACAKIRISNIFMCMFRIFKVNTTCQKARDMTCTQHALIPKSSYLFCITCT